MSVKVTIDQMRTYARSLDERLEERAKYSDGWIDSRIDDAFELVSTYGQKFLKDETLDLTQHIKDQVKKFVITLDEDVVGFKRIYAIVGGDSILPQNDITWYVKPDNSIHVVMNTDKLDETSENMFVVEYYYFPKAPITETFMSTDIWHMMKNAIQKSVWDALRDFEKSNMAFQSVKEDARTVINGLDIDIYPEDEWNGGFLL